jgi:hypothetical protein
MSPPSGSTAPARKHSEGSEALVRLRRGEVTLDAYLDFRVEESLKALRGLVPPAALEIARETLRAELVADPVLVELLKRLTAREPEDLLSG